MAVEPDTPDDWRTVKIQGRKADLSPDATVENIFKIVRQLIVTKQLQPPGGTSAHSQYNAEYCAIIRKADVGTDEDGNWLKPEGPEDYVSYDLSEVEDGDELRAFNAAAEEHPVYPEAVDE